jgi:RNA polymerase sigma-70 factor (ECF subfamily)
MDAPQETEHEEAQTRELVQRGVEMIPPKYREVLVLHYFENLSYKEIAHVLRIPVGTVGIRLARARMALKKTFPQSYTLSV